MKKHLLLSLVLIFALKTLAFAQEAMPSTEDVMKKAYAQAKAENKKVFVMFHASWCGWCKKMEASMNEPALKKFFDDNYVIATLDVQEKKEKKTLKIRARLLL